MPDSDRSHLVLIGGRAGVGKSSVASEMHALLSDANVKHAVIEGDALDLAWPAPWEHNLAERNLAAMWSNYRNLGYRRLVLTNTVSVLQQREYAEALGDDPLVTAIMLQSSHETARQRLARRETGSQLQSHIERSADRAEYLEYKAPANVIRIRTDARSITGIAREILRTIGWFPAEKDERND